MNCRHCHSSLNHVFLDLGFAPPSNAYLTSEDLNAPEVYFPLKLFVCDNCWLVQTEDYSAANEIFKDDYAYFSSISQSWLAHAANYCEMITKRLNLDKSSFVIEIASNDGYLLKNFVSSQIPCLGIEPTDSTAQAAEKVGVPVIREFFGESLAKKLLIEGKTADLIAGNNVYAHVPDINDFTAGLKIALKPNGTITLEFPHLMRLLENNQFDTVYHEHYSYLSLFTVNEIFKSCGLRIFDVEELSTHGGSIRVYGCHAEDARPTKDTVNSILEEEFKRGMRNIKTYIEFQPRADQIKNDLAWFLIELKRNGKSIIAYGAAAKGNTLLNYAGIKPDLLPLVCDAAPSKQGKLLPGSHIPIVAPEKLIEYKPDFVIIMPWNISHEVISQHSYIRDWGGKFVTAIPELRVIG
ncbi:class I SAM-dependent methyltransferase [Myxococcota bacterium]|nr:class I SAM-dependent methyltransferase [Myxococcota bacterium]MBU1381416.1 class I SAM-dependent methyltransferase [Myxococcota bacterium]MBU1498893.1 class I SAM-dependent methyltransferase [Myxococcota bacterium]